MLNKVFTFWKKKEKPKITWWSKIEGLEKGIGSEVTNDLKH